MSVHTLQNLTDTKCPRCHKYMIENECLCSFVDMPTKSDLRKVSDTHWIHDSTTQTLVSYDLRPNEFGAWECSCAGFAHRRDCKHVRRLCDLLYTSPQVLTAQPAPEKPKLLLEHLFDGHPLTPTEKARETRFNKKTA